MAFWGVEIKPGKPFTHSCEKARGRLRISRATMGLGDASKKFHAASEKFGATSKTIVQCNVGNRRPVLLCVLMSDKKESCHLGLEFEEVDDVVFSVIGPRSVCLTGYYVQKNHRSNCHSDTESYGVDIENTQTDGSSYHSGDDMYEDSFINDDDNIKVSPRSPVLSSRGVDEFTLVNENTLVNEKSKDQKSHGKELKKRNQVIESDNDANSHDYEDEDGSLSVFKSKIAVKITMFGAGEKIAQATKEMDDEAKEDDGLCGSESNQKNYPLDINSRPEGEREPSLDGEKTEVNEQMNELPEEEETLEKTIVSIQDAVHGNNPKDTSVIQNLPASNGKDTLQSLELEKLNKKRKKGSKKQEKKSKVQDHNEDHSVLREDKDHEVEASTVLGLGQNSLVTNPELGSSNGQKSAKRRKKLLLDGLLTEGIDEKCHNIPEEDLSIQDSLNANNVIKDLSAANGESRAGQWGCLRLLSHLCGEYEDQEKLQETCVEQIVAKFHTMPREDEVMQEPNCEVTTVDVITANAENKEQQIDNNVAKKTELLPNAKQDKKIKKKRKKTKGERGLNVGEIEMTDNQGITPTKYDDQSTNTTPLQKRNLPSGLIIEELVSGPLNGKVAAPGKRVKIHYTGMLKESGHVFQSTVGKSACKFCLGDEEFIDGWNVGIEGMHVGDKRRLIIPPSMAFGDEETEGVPPNSWVIYDIELVSVLK